MGSYNSVIEKRKGVYEFICAFCQKWGYPPTIREIAQGVGISSPSNVIMYLDHLEGDGLIKRGKGAKSRSIQVVGAVWIRPEVAETLNQILGGG